MKDNGAHSFTEGSEPIKLTADFTIDHEHFKSVQGANIIRLTDGTEFIRKDVASKLITDQFKQERNKAIDAAISEFKKEDAYSYQRNRLVPFLDIISILESLKSESKMNTEEEKNDLPIGIEAQFDPVTAAQHYTLYDNICRIPDGREFLNAVNEGIKKSRELQDQLKQRDETIKQKDEEMKLRLAERGKTVDAWIQTSITQREEVKQLREALKNLIPIAERTAITVDNVDWRTQWETKRKALETATKLLTK